jgi:succinyl-diaminopimelate desuccinylase
VSDLLARTAELVAIPSVSHGEQALADRVDEALRACPHLAVERIGDNIVARTELDRPSRLVLAGHLDTVPPNGNAHPVVEGDVLWGVGAADMKGSLAVMLDLAAAVAEPAVDVTWCFYAREELGRDENGLHEVWRTRPELLAADAAILGEPTDGLVEAGCQGTLRVAVTLTGRRAHTARPFTGRNAIHRLGPLLTAVATWERRKVTLDGCDYVEQLQAVSVEGGVAANVVPDRATVTLNHRYAPDRDGAAALAFVTSLLDEFVVPGDGDRVEVLDQADGAPPSLDQPLLARLVAATGSPPRAKVGWTDVASFHQHGIPAANFGSGDPLLAHHPDERVERASLVQVRAVLAELLGAAPGD